MIASPRFADHREHLAAIRRAALQAADPYQAVRTAVRLDGSTLLAGGRPSAPLRGPLAVGVSCESASATPTGRGSRGRKGTSRRIALKPESRVIVAGAGKGGVGMARALADALGSRLTAGVVAVPRVPAAQKEALSAKPGSRRLVFVQAGHPLLDEGSLEAGRRIRDLLADTRPEDLVLAPISGGGSALLELPRPGLTLADLRATNDLLLGSGATIQEINVVRQHLSQLKGGGLARMASPAPVVGLILSDVVGDPVHLIASGPTAPPPQPEDALAVVDRYALTARLPPAVLACLRFPAPPTSIHQSPVTNLLVGSNTLALQAAAGAARELRFRTAVQPEPLVGDAREAGNAVGQQVRRAREAGGPTCLAWGGETTVNVRGRGKGGRNQEVALGAAIALRGVDGVAVMAVGTDGIDGPTDAAGAIVTGETVVQGEARGLSAEAALADNDAYTYLQSLAALVITGPTGTNVNDLTVGLVY